MTHRKEASRTQPHTRVEVSRLEMKRRPTQCHGVVVAMMHGVQSWCRDGVQLVSRQDKYTKLRSSVLSFLAF
jgi:hypothetical protein